MKNNVMSYLKSVKYAVRNIYLLPIVNVTVPCVVPKLSIAIILRDVRLIMIAPIFIRATIRGALITIGTKQVQAAADSTQRTQTIVRTIARYVAVMV